MRVLVLGASGMLGSAMYRLLAQSPGMQVLGTLRSPSNALGLPTTATSDLACGVSASDLSGIASVMLSFKPSAVVNCIGVVKQLDESKDPRVSILINALFPHQIADMCRDQGSRLVHISTDCVFSGRRGGYTEDDFPDCADLYGRSKLLGEVADKHCITLRTSIIGPEPSGRASGLVGWFLRQSGSAKGYRRAIFSGLPTVTLATAIRDLVLPRTGMHGLYHMSADPIDKFTLLKLVRDRWGKEIRIDPVDEPAIDRSLDSSRFRRETGFRSAPWDTLVEEMHAFG